MIFSAGREAIADDRKYSHRYATTTTSDRRLRVSLPAVSVDAPCAHRSFQQLLRSLFIGRRNSAQSAALRLNQNGPSADSVTVTNKTTAVHVRLDALRAMFAKRDDPYAGADLANARRLGALLLVMDAVLCLALFAVDPLDDELGGAGWAVGILGVLLLLLGASRLIASRRVGFNELLAFSYLLVAQLALFEWLAGGHSSTYPNLYLLPVLFTAGVHPPRRLVGVLIAVAVASSASLVYAGWDSSEAADIGVQLLLWVALAGLVMVLMTGVRGQRITLRADEEQAQRLARLDPLTGLGNRRAFDETLSAEIERARRAGGALSVVILDVDDFKQINDGFGHLNGDRCLRDVATKLSEAARANDTCFRWGGDEFALLLPDSDYEGALHVAKRFRDVVATNCRRPDGQTLGITCGTAELTEAANADDFLAAADLALMSLKTPSETLEPPEGSSEAVRDQDREPRAATRRSY